MELAPNYRICSILKYFERERERERVRELES